MAEQNIDIDMDIRAELDAVTNEYMQLQVTCMLLQHEGCNTIRANDSENGLIILEAVNRMRNTLNEQHQMLVDTVGEQEFTLSCERIDFDKKLFSLLSDTVLNDNILYFDLGPRPKNSAFACNESVCNRSALKLAHEYFPDMFGTAA